MTILTTTLSEVCGQPSRTCKRNLIKNKVRECVEKTHKSGYFKYNTSNRTIAIIFNVFLL